MLELHPQQVPDVGSTRELRAAVVAARHRLHDVLDARQRTLSALGSWRGPHRDRYDADLATLLGTGESLADDLDALARALDHELETADAAAAGTGTLP